MFVHLTTSRVLFPTLRACNAAKDDMPISSDTLASLQTPAAVIDLARMPHNILRDRGTQKQKCDFGYGQVCGIDGAVLPGYVLRGAHACATGAPFPEYHALAQDGELTTWSRFHGW
jgi:hypothetical protein